MRQDSDKLGPVMSLIVIAVSIGVLFALRGCTSCSHKGQVQVSRVRGDQMEVCDGANWVPYLAPIPSTIQVKP